MSAYKTMSAYMTMSAYVLVFLCTCSEDTKSACNGVVDDIIFFYFGINHSSSSVSELYFDLQREN